MNIMWIVTLAAFAVPDLALAQLAPSSMSRLRQLPSPPNAEQIVQLASTDENAYVYFLQDFLREQGLFDNQPDGQLTMPTVRAILSFCGELEIGELCARGPLLPAAIAATAEGVAAALAPPVPEIEQPAEAPMVPEAVVAESETVAAEPLPAAAEAEPEVAVAGEEPAAAAETMQPGEAIAPATLPEGWRINENGGRGALGLGTTIVEAGTDSASLRVWGVAMARGYINIEFSVAQPAAPGVWSAAVSGAVNSDLGETLPGWMLRTAVYDAESYIGELFEGVALPVEAGMQTVTGSAALPSGATRLLPYVQLYVEAGDAVDATVILESPRLEKRD